MKELILAILQVLRANGIEGRVGALYEEGQRCLIIVLPGISPDILEDGHGQRHADR